MKVSKKRVELKKLKECVSAIEKSTTTIEVPIELLNVMGVSQYLVLTSLLHITVKKAKEDLGNFDMEGSYPIRIQELSDMLGYCKQTVVKNLKNLEDKKMIQKISSKTGPFGYVRYKINSELIQKFL